MGQQDARIHETSKEPNQIVTLSQLADKLTKTDQQEGLWHIVHDELALIGETPEDKAPSRAFHISTPSFPNIDGNTYNGRYQLDGSSEEPQYGMVLMIDCYTTSEELLIINLYFDPTSHKLLAIALDKETPMMLPDLGYGPQRHGALHDRARIDFSEMTRTFQASTNIYDDETRSSNSGNAVDSPEDFDVSHFMEVIQAVLCI